MRPNGTAIRAIRTAQNMSLRMLSGLTALERGYLSRLERGHIREPAQDKLLRIADVLGVPHTAITHEETP